MQKVLLSFLIGCMGVISAHAATAISLDGNIGSIQEGNNDEISPDLPHPMVILAYSFYYDPDKSGLIVWGWDDPYHVILENLSTGEHYFYSDDYLSEEYGFIPFTGGDGLWRVSYCSAIPHDPRIFIDRYFVMDNGVFTRLF